MAIVRCYFDFLSPYAFLALQKLEGFADKHELQWQLCPVVYGAILDRTGLVGPAEVPAKRRYTWADVQRLAHVEGWQMKGPPAHPFRSLEALRAFWLYRDEAQAVRLAAALSWACWVDGRDLTDVDVLSDVIACNDLDAADLADRIRSQAAKDGLKELTEQALAEGVFGVPSFVWQGEVFWGHDRMKLLSLALRGELPGSSVFSEAMLARPRQAERRGSPLARD